MHAHKKDRLKDLFEQTTELRSQLTVIMLGIDGDEDLSSSEKENLNEILYALNDKIKDVQHFEKLCMQAIDQIEHGRLSTT